MELDRKLALKGRRLQILGAPAGLRLSLANGSGSEVGLLAFVHDLKALQKIADVVVESAVADRLTWVAYPKRGKLETDLNRDSLAAALKKRGVRPVSQIAIDETWSALRFRA